MPPATDTGQSHHVIRDDVNQPRHTQQRHRHRPRCYFISSNDDEDCASTILRNMFIRNRQEEMDRAHELQKRNHMLEDAIAAIGMKKKRKKYYF